MVPACSHKVPRVSWYSGSCSASFRFAYGALTLSGRSFQNRSATVRNHKCSPNPGVHALRFGLFPFRSPLLWKSHVVFSSSGYLDVSVHRVPSIWLLRTFVLYSPYSDRSFSCRVSPFRNRRVNGYLLLTAAYRSLSRLSSALSAKASTLRSCSLDLLFQCISDNTPATVLRR